MKKIFLNQQLSFYLAYSNISAYSNYLVRVYPAITERLIDGNVQNWNAVETVFSKENILMLLEENKNLKLLPAKDSYIAHLKRERAAIVDNPKKGNRICSRSSTEALHFCVSDTALRAAQVNISKFVRIDCSNIYNFSKKNIT